MTARRARISGIVYVVLVALVLIALLAGCGRRRVMMDPHRLPSGLVIVLPGIDGRAPHNLAACRALCTESTGMAVELYDWTAPLGPLYNQRACGRNREMARQLAGRIAEYRGAWPDRPVSLIGHSGGTAIAVWAAEALPDDQQVEGIVLLASSLSRGYDLSQALRRSRKGIVSFHSPRDGILLGVGTSVFGTMDGHYGEAAGKAGFTTPQPASRHAAYAKLCQVGCGQSTAAAGHDGGHFSCLAPSFIAARVQPLLTAARWDRETIARTRGRRMLSATSASAVALSR